MTATTTGTRIIVIDKVKKFGISRATVPTAIEVYWRDGRRRRIIVQIDMRPAGMTAAEYIRADVAEYLAGVYAPGPAPQVELSPKAAATAQAWR